MTAVVGKLFHVLECIAEDEGDSVSLAALTKRTGLPKATLYRLLGDLVEPGIVEHGRGGYSLGGRLFELGASVPRYRRLREAALPHLEQLRDVTTDTVHLGVLTGHRVVVLEKVHGRHGARIPTAVGSQHPLHSNALGKVLLAYGDAQVLDDVLDAGLRPLTPRTVVTSGRLLQQLGRVRDDGYAAEFEESRLGLGCLAAPVFGGDGAVIGAVSVAGDPSTRSSGAARRLTGTAALISRTFQTRAMSVR